MRFMTGLFGGFVALFWGAVLACYKLAMERGSLSREMYESYAEKISEQSP